MIDQKNASDPTAEEWAEEVWAELEARRQWSAQKRAEFVLRKLSGPARREVMARGVEVSQNAEEAMRVVLAVFGEDVTPSKLQERLFNTRQGDGEGLIRLSLRLVDIINRLEAVDPSIRDQREQLLKDRFCAAVRDADVRREVRRLNLEQPGLSFFEVRSRAVEWIGEQEAPRRKTQATSEAIEPTPGLAEQLAQLSRQVGELAVSQQRVAQELQALKGETSSSSGLLPRRQRWGQRPPRRNENGELICYKCGKPGHIAVECPQQQPASN